MAITTTPSSGESDKLIRNLRSRICERRAAVIVGSGVSIGAVGGPGKAPTVSWTGLLRDGVEEVIALKRAPSPIWPSIQRQILDAADASQASLKDLLGVAEQLSDCLGYPDDGLWGAWLRRSFATLEPANNAVLSALAALGVPLATTNYDGLLEGATTLPPVTWQDGPRVLRVLQGQEHGILHLHGYWDQPASVILGIRAYEGVLRNTLAQFLQQMLAAGRSLIFVGCGEGLADPNFARLRQWLSATLKGTEHVHYRLCRDSEVDELSRAHAPEEHVIPVAYGAGRDDLAPFLRSLVEVASPPPPPSTALSPPRLPARRLFVGREAEKAALLAAILDETRPIAIIGPPGIGKSALTRQALHDAGIATRFGERRWFVRLDDANDERGLWAAILLSLGATTIGPDPATQALPLLRERKGLLVLDNLESPWEADTGPVEEALALLSDVAGLRVVASVRGMTWPSGIDWLEASSLKPLPLGQAREFFLRIAGAGFAHDPHLDAIAAALDGLPLAIELIARQAQGIGKLAELFAEFGRLKTELFEFGEGKDLSLHASLALSLASPKMTGQGRRLFTLMGRLPAGAAFQDLNRLLPGGGSAAGRVLQQLGLAFDDEAGRLRMLAPIREHAATRPVGDIGPLVRHYMRLAETLGSGIGRAGGAEAVGRSFPEVANLEAVVDLAIGKRALRQALAAQYGLCRLMQVTGLGSPNVLGRLAAAADRAGNVSGKADCIFSLGDIARIRSLYDVARGHFDTALRLYRQVGAHTGEANCLFHLGEIARVRSQHDDARGYFDTARRLFQKARSPQGEAHCIRSLGEIARQRSHYDEAGRHLDTALRHYRQVGDVQGEAHCIRGMGNIARACSHLDEAREHFETALRLFRQAGDVHGGASCANELGEIASARSEHDEARRQYETALQLFRQIGSVLGEAHALSGLGEIASARAQHDKARGHFEMALRLFRQIGNALGPANCFWSLGEISRECFQHEEAARYYRDAMAAYWQVADVWGQAACTLGLGQLAAAVGERGAEPQLRAALDLFEQTGDLRGRGKALLELARMATVTTDKRRLLLEALDSHTRFGDPRWVGETHRALARMTEGAERAEYLRQVRDAWAGIGRSDLISGLDAEFGTG